MAGAATSFLGFVRLVVLVLGLAITYYSLKAYWRTKTRYMRDASIGFGIITLGVFIEGVLFEFLSVDVVFVHIIESVAIGLGFVVLSISLRR